MWPHRRPHRAGGQPSALPRLRLSRGSRALGGRPQARRLPVSLERTRCKTLRWLSCPRAPSIRWQGVDHIQRICRHKEAERFSAATSVCNAVVGWRHAPHARWRLDRGQPRFGAIAVPPWRRPTRSGVAAIPEAVRWLKRYGRKQRSRPQVPASDHARARGRRQVGPERAGGRRGGAAGRQAQEPRRADPDPRLGSRHLPGPPPGVPAGLGGQPAGHHRPGRRDRGRRHHPRGHGLRRQAPDQRRGFRDRDPSAAYARFHPASPSRSPASPSTRRS